MPQNSAVSLKHGPPVLASAFLENGDLMPWFGRKRREEERRRLEQERRREEERLKEEAHKKSADMRLVRVWHLEPYWPWEKAMIPFYEDTERVGFPLEDRFFTLDRLFDGKENENVLVSGGSGTGKTTLMNYLIQHSGRPSLIFSFKHEDLTLRLPGFKLIDVSTFLPDAFVDRDAFITAYMISYPISFTGVMASTIPTVLAEAWSNASDWTSFLRALDDLRERFSRDSMRLSIVNTAASRFRGDLIPSTVSDEPWRWDFKTPTILDFSELNEAQKTFFAELVLRNLWRDVQTKHPREFIIALDEAHRVLRISAQVYRSILDEMSREIRGLGGALYICSQNISDVYEDIRNQMATQLAAKTKHDRDLSMLMRIHHHLPKVAGELISDGKIGVLEFFDSRQPGLIYDLRTFTLNQLPAYLGKTPERVSGVVKRPEAVKPRVKPARMLTPEERLELRDDLARYLAEHVSFVSHLGRHFSEKWRKDPERLKVDIHRELRELVGEGLLIRLPLTDQWGQPLVWYAARTKGEGLLHRALVDAVLSVFSAHRLEARRVGGEGNPDVIFGEIAVEAETGLKEKMGGFRGMVSDRLTTFSECWVVVPSPEQKARYLQAVGKIAQVMTLFDLNKQLMGWGRG